MRSSRASTASWRPAGLRPPCGSDRSILNGFTPPRRALAGRPGASLTVDLESQTITGPAGDAIRFEIDAFRKHGLLTGQDEVEMTLARLPAIEAFEARRRGEMSWLG